MFIGGLKPDLLARRATDHLEQGGKGYLPFLFFLAKSSRLSSGCEAMERSRDQFRQDVICGSEDN